MSVDCRSILKYEKLCFYRVGGINYANHAKIWVGPQVAHIGIGGAVLSTNAVNARLVDGRM